MKMQSPFFLPLGLATILLIAGCSATSNIEVKTGDDPANSPASQDENCEGSTCFSQSTDPGKVAEEKDQDSATELEQILPVTNLENSVESLAKLLPDQLPVVTENLLGQALLFLDDQSNLDNQESLKQQLVEIIDRYIESEDANSFARDLEAFQDTGENIYQAECASLDPSLVKAGTTYTDCNGQQLIGTLQLEQGGDENSQPTPVTEALPNCSTDGQTNCVSTDTFPAIDKSLLTPANLRLGIVIGGITGSYPSVTHPLVGSTTTPDLTKPTFTAKLKSDSDFEYFDSAGIRHVDSGDSDIVGTNILNSVSIFSEPGAVSIPSACSSNQQTNCIANTSYRAADLTQLLPGNILYGSTIAGVDGAGGKVQTLFITSTTYTGNFGSLATADGHCQARATAGGLLGTWKAVISDDTESVSSRLNIDGIAFQTIDGRTLETSPTRFLANNLLNPIRKDEFGVDVAGTRSWTGTSTGGVSHGSNCNNWTSDNSANSGSVGSTAGSTWLQNSGRDCDTLQHLTCIDGQD